MKSLDAFKLKMIAIAAMTIDHIAWLLPLNNMTIPYFMHVFGRITAPIMWFFIAEGCHYTKDWKRYFTRMLVFAVISHFAYCFYEGYPYHVLYTSVMWPLALSILLIANWEKKIANIYITEPIVRKEFAKILNEYPEASRQEIIGRVLNAVYNNFIDEDLITAVKVNKNLVLNFNGLKAESNNIVKETIPELFERNWARAQ